MSVWCRMRNQIRFGSSNNVLNDDTGPSDNPYVLPNWEKTVSLNRDTVPPARFRKDFWRRLQSPPPKAETVNVPVQAPAPPTRTSSKRIFGHSKFSPSPKIFKKLWTHADKAKSTLGKERETSLPPSTPPIRKRAWERESSAPPLPQKESKRWDPNWKGLKAAQDCHGSQGSMSSLFGIHIEQKSRSLHNLLKDNRSNFENKIRDISVTPPIRRRRRGMSQTSSSGSSSSILCEHPPIASKAFPGTPNLWRKPVVGANQLFRTSQCDPKRPDINF